MGGRLTGRIPAPIKRRVPALRERDALRVEVARLRSRVRELEGGAAAPDMPMPSHALHGAYAGDGRMLVSTLWGGRLFAPANDLSLMPELVTSGTYDEPFTAFLQRELKPGDTVFDVGAHIGLFTVLAAYQVWEFGHVVTYEASPRILAFLRDNVAMNWLLDRVEIIPKAAAPESGRLRFLAPRRFTGSGSVQPVEHLLVGEDRLEEIEEIEVEAEPLDVQAGRFERIDLIKIDVEGAEEKVFAGMERLLSSGVVRRVSFEVTAEHMGDDWPAFTERLRAYDRENWQFAAIAESGVPEPITVGQVIERGRMPQVLMTSQSA